MFGNESLLQLSSPAIAVLGRDSSLSHFDFHIENSTLKTVVSVNIWE